MARVIDGFTNEPQDVTKPTYPWEEWVADEQSHVVVQGVDFLCMPHAFKGQLSRAAKRYDKRVSVFVLDPNTPGGPTSIRFQFVRKLNGATSKESLKPKPRLTHPDERTVANKPSPYPWDKWLNGHVYEAEHGVDFTCSVRSFRARLYGAAGRYGKGHTSSVTSPTTVRFKFWDK